MADKTTIEWTDATWNPITGCSVVSPGCANCYAMRLAGTRLQHHPSRKGLTHDSKAGPVWTGEVRLNEEWLKQPLQWRRPRKIFVCAHGDLFHEAVPDEWIDRVFVVMALSPQHIFQVLTKRPERMRDYIRRRDQRGGIPAPDLAALITATRQYTPAFDLRKGWPLPNVWLGVSVEDQRRADERIPHLLATPAAVRWISAEPLLEPVNLYGCDPSPEHGIPEAGPDVSLEAYWRHDDPPDSPPRPGIDWVVVGGESGPGVRPMLLDWARSIRDQCAAADVPIFVKQLSGSGGWAIKSVLSFPPDLRLRQFPVTTHAA
jgi:protein gp37